MAKKLYVGGLPYAISEDEFRTLFEEVGAVSSVAIIKDKMTGRSKGFGFVEMESDEDANRAISTLDGREVGGRKIGVSEARPLEPRPRNDNRY